jgi:hypothetical protein
MLALRQSRRRALHRGSKTNDTLGVGINDRVGGFADDGLQQAADVAAHGIIRNGRCSVGHRFPR